MIWPDGEGDKVKFCDKINTGKVYTKNWKTFPSVCQG